MFKYIFEFPVYKCSYKCNNVVHDKQPLPLKCSHAVSHNDVTDLCVVVLCCCLLLRRFLH